MILMQELGGPVTVWLGVAIAAAIVEVATPHFGSVFVSGAALAAAATAGLSAGLSVQMAVFAIVLTVSFVALRPWFVTRMGSSRGVPSRTAQLIGKDGVVTHDIDPTVGSGRVNVGGEDWMARSRDRLSSGTRVQVVGADGIVLEVKAT